MGRSDEPRGGRRGGADVGGGGDGGGVDINRVLLHAPKTGTQPPMSTVNARTSNKDHRRKKKDQDKVMILSRGDVGAKPAPAVMQVQQKKKKNEGSTSKGKGAKAQRESIETLKQQLFEATRDLDKERNTREMWESKVKSLSSELKLVKEKLGEDKHYCVSSLKEELEFEQKLRVSVQQDLAKANNLVVAEQNRVRVLEKDIESEKNAYNSLKRELHAAKGEINSELARQQPLQIELAEAKQKVQGLQKRLQYEAAANIAVRMELQSIKGRGEDDEREEEMKRTRSATIDVAEYTAIKMELQAANEKLKSMKHIEEGLKREKRERRAAAKEDQTQPSLALKSKSADEKDRLVRRLRKELHETRERLKNEQKKSAGGSQLPRKKCGPKPALSDWLGDIQVAPTSNRQHAGLIPIIQAPSSTNMPRPIETSLPGSTEAPPSPPPAETPTPSQPASSEPPSLFHFEDDDVSLADDKALEPLHDELTFIQSAYDQDEIIISDNTVTHIMELTTGYEEEVIKLALKVIIPDSYPHSGYLDVKASIEDSICPHQVRKCAIDALPKLEELCTWEAQANEGREAIHPVFSVASGWAQVDWYNILSKELHRGEFESNDASVDICVLLIYAHHLVEPDRIQSIKKNASKLSLGGFVKIGKPGLILVEGTEADCDQMIEALAQFMKNKQKVFHASTFKVGGKAMRQEKDMDCRCLPRKMEELEGKSGMDELSSSCEKLGLHQALNDIISL